jgi:hypothetical protein
MLPTYWPDWEKFLARYGMKSLASALLSHARPLLPIATQVMFLGLPLFKGISGGSQYAALLDTLGDEDQIRQFSDYLQESGA